LGARVGATISYLTAFAGSDGILYLMLAIIVVHFASFYAIQSQAAKWTVRSGDGHAAPTNFHMFRGLQNAAGYAWIFEVGRRDLTSSLAYLVVWVARLSIVALPILFVVWFIVDSGRL